MKKHLFTLAITLALPAFAHADAIQAGNGIAVVQTQNGTVQGYIHRDILTYKCLNRAGNASYTFIGRGVTFFVSRKILLWDKGVELEENEFVNKKKEESLLIKAKSRIGIQEKRKTVNELEYIAQALDKKSDL